MGTFKSTLGGIVYTFRNRWILVILIGIISSYSIITYHNVVHERSTVLTCIQNSMNHAQDILKSHGKLSVRNDTLYLGSFAVNGANAFVDSISSKTGFGCSIFLKDVRIATNAKMAKSDQRAMGTTADQKVKKEVIDEGVAYTGMTRTLDQNWLIQYIPLRDATTNKVVGMLALFTNEEAFIANLFGYRLTLGIVLGVLFILLFYTFMRLSIKSKRLDEESVKSESNEASYKSLFEQSFDLIQAVDGDGKFLYVNPAWKEALGYSDEDIAALNILEVIHPDYHAHCRSVLKNIFSVKRVSNIEVVFVTKSGDTIFVIGNIHCEEKYGQLHTKWIFRNDSSRKLAHERLKESEKKFRSLVESVNDIIYRTDVKGDFTYVNDKATEVTGYDAVKLLGMNYLDIIEDKDKARCERTFKDFFKRRAKSNYSEYRIQTKDGQSRWIGQNVTTMFENGAGEKIKGYTAVARDITERKENQKLIKKAHDQLNLKNMEITSSINYAKMIQEAHLPKFDILQQHFSNSFLIYKPKDIVSGDFYWFGETENSLVVAVGDCTGHGVPGAFMTMIALNQLNTIVHEKKETEPSVILQQLDIAVSNGLRNGNFDAPPAMDGMDVGICTFDKEGSLMHYAGARRPLFMASQGSLSIVAPTKKSIGEIIHSDSAYESQAITYEQGDVFYLFSDGLTDQFGGERTKKYSLKRIRNLIMEHAHLSHGDQQELFEHEFTSWKKNNEQTDDVVLLGIKI